MDSVNYEDLLVPVPHPCTTRDIQARETALGEIGLYYPMLYTTLFMWPVETLGWEVFMLAAVSEQKRFHDQFLLPCVQKSKAIVAEMARASNSPFLYVHDDLASATGPFFRPAWYDDYIFPHYPDIWQEAKAAGKKIMFVADGNMTQFLSRLVDVGVDGIMFENPATPLEAVIEHFGQSGKFMIGGIETVTLTSGTPEDVRRMVFELYENVQDIPGFAVASCGGLHGNIPIENLEAYFDARAEIGATPNDWRCRSTVS
jgi:uroporphyrinogen-III decarboxylase